MVPMISAVSRQNQALGSERLRLFPSRQGHRNLYASTLTDAAV